ncbi:MAG: hypothetical protein KC503_43850 [Myxococcales bacterium]|nr:hypothetical protein [Myxococcales bacterium]
MSSRLALRVAALAVLAAIAIKPAPAQGFVRYRSKAQLEADLRRVAHPAVARVVSVTAGDVRGAKGLYGFALFSYEARAPTRQLICGVLLYFGATGGLRITWRHLGSTERLAALALVDLARKRSVVPLRWGRQRSALSLGTRRARVRRPLLLIEATRSSVPSESRRLVVLDVTPSTLRRGGVKQLLQLTSLESHRASRGSPARFRGIAVTRLTFERARGTHRLRVRQTPISTRNNPCRAPEPDVLTYTLTGGRYKKTAIKRGNRCP